MSLSLMISLSICAILHAALAQSSSSSTRLRVEYIDSPLTIDVPTPRFSYALVHSNRGEVQTAYHIVVQRILPGSEPQTVWDSSLVTSSTSLNIPYGSSTTPLVSDSDYLWTITWADSTGTLSTPVTGTFSTSWLGGEKEFSVADWISSTSDTQNTYRTEFTLPTTQAEFPVRARMYITGLGYAKTWLNGQLTDDHELGQFTTFQQRTLYDVVDLTSQVRMGCNSLGVMLGLGWFAQDSIKAGPRQFRLVLSFTDSTGKVTLMASKNTGTSSDLVFKAISGPVTADDIYNGETYDARIAANISGWLSCGYNDASWSSTIIPTITPTSFNAVISSHAVLIKTDRTYSVTPGGITQPTDTAYVFDFGQNMAGQTLLRVEDCPVGTIITLIHNEILNVDGTVNRNLAKMVGTYICSGVGGIEEYRTLFTYYGFRYVQIEGYPGIPGEEAITAFFIHSDVPQSGEFMSSNLLLNKIQHATRFASWSNLMDIPTDCPQRERRGWLGDAQLSFETVIHNVDGGGFYTKWLNDFADTQVYDNRTMNTDGALPDCIPFYGHGHPSADPGWGIAAWTITDWFSDYYADDVFDVAWYPNMVWYVENWIKLAQANNGLFPLFFWGDWANYVPGPYAFKTDEYPQFFYVRALQITSKFAARLNHPDDAAKYAALATDAINVYQTLFFNSTTNCYAACTYVSQILALTLGLAGPQGSPTEQAVWANAMNWWSANATKGVPEHFGGGIISLKLAAPLLDAHGETALALKMHLQTDKAPSFGYWVETGDMTTLWEQYDMTATEGSASRNHIMFGGMGSWYFTSLAGLQRVQSSRSWSNLILAPPTPDSGVYDLNLTSASASIDTPMGLVAISWNLKESSSSSNCGTSSENGPTLHLVCTNGVFTNVTFASFGTPSGSCPGPFHAGSCNAADSVAIVSAACLGKKSCSISPTNDFFNGDPCVNTLKSLSVLMNSCDGPKNLVRMMLLDATVPVGSKATVVIPTFGGAATASIMEGSENVWANGAFVPGVPGITSAVASSDGKTISFPVGSGVYSFQVFQPS